MPRYDHSHGFLPLRLRLAVQYSAVTRSIRVSVTPTYLEDQSSPEDSHYVWKYEVRIENRGEETIRLVNRYWRITDARGQVHEVRGEGVVGKQPVLRPGQRFEYASGTPLSTSSGFMAGSYEMVLESGERFDVTIPTFSLDLPAHRGTSSPVRPGMLH
jgi:ApaG protein